LGSPSIPASVDTIELGLFDYRAGSGSPATFGGKSASASLFDQGLVQVLEAAVTGLEPGKPYVLALASEPSGTGVLEPLQGFMTTLRAQPSLNDRTDPPIGARRGQDPRSLLGGLFGGRGAKKARFFVRKASGEDNGTIVAPANQRSAPPSWSQLSLLVHDAIALLPPCRTA
jgi:hypothetical protein